MTLRVLVTGAAGQVGSEVVRVCTARGDDVVAGDREQLDVNDRDAVLGIVTALRPDVVVHCAAWTAVDACESDPGRAFAANAAAVRWVGEACRRADAHLVALSTDYVFDGTKVGPYHEWDVPNPMSVYGASKLAGEHEASASGASATVVRTSWVCGAVGANMVKTVLRLAGEPGGRLRFVDDQHGHPTFAADLASMLRRLGVERRTGTYHVTNQGAVSWYGFVREVLRAAGHDPDAVEPIVTADLQPPRPARRPANSVLANVALAASGTPLLRDFREPLAELVRALGA